MPNYYIKQKVFSFAAKFDIYDSNSVPVLSARGEVFSFGKKLHLTKHVDPDSASARAGYDPPDLAYIEQKLFCWLPTYFITDMQTGRTVTVKKNFTLFRSSFSIEELGWEIEGNILDHDYAIHSTDGKYIAQISKEWFTFGDAFRISVPDSNDALMVIAVCLVIDAILDSENSSAAFSSST